MFCYYVFYTTYGKIQMEINNFYSIVKNELHDTYDPSSCLSFATCVN